MMAEIENWRDAPLWDPESIEEATRDLVRNALAGVVRWKLRLAGDYRRKIKTVDELCSAARAAAAASKTVMMCHGVFDLVHPGHIRHLLYAKEKADILIASLTADAPHHQGELSSLRSAGSARAQSRGAGNGRLRHHRR